MRSTKRSTLPPPDVPVHTSSVGVPISAPTIIEPAGAARLAPDLSSGMPKLWVYRYVHPFTRWRLSIATHAEPGSQKLSLGGFRIAPEARTSSPGFDSDREAVGLAIGMEEKVYWSRLLGIGGPLARKNLARIVGGKCVLHPTPEARVASRATWSCSSSPSPASRMSRPARDSASRLARTSATASCPTAGPTRSST